MITTAARLDSQATLSDQVQDLGNLKDELALPAAANADIRHVTAKDIILDPEFQSMIPPPPPDEHSRMVNKFFQEGCTEPLLVWHCQGRLILLTGYEFIAALAKDRLGFVVHVKTFAIREHARLFIITQRLCKPNLTPLEISYLQGLRYNDQKQGSGGDRRSGQARLHFAGKTCEALAEIFCVSPGTIRRAAALVAAVKTITGHAGPDPMPLLFSRKANLKRDTVMDLSKLPAEKLRPLMGVLRMTGKLPRDWRRRAGVDDMSAITVPVEPQAMARTLLRRLGPDWLTRFSSVIETVLASERDKNAGTLHEENQLRPEGRA